jgi:hypothetical protein
MLSHYELSAAVRESSLIQFADMSQVNGSSVDVRLGSSLLVESSPAGLSKGVATVVGLRERESPLFEELQLSEDQPFLLAPGQFVLAVTQETFRLPGEEQRGSRRSRSFHRCSVPPRMVWSFDVGVEQRHSAPHHQVAVWGLYRSNGVPQTRASPHRNTV